MSTLHKWFRSGHYSLLCHLDSPDAVCASRGIVIVPPFGWEDVCAYRPLRFLARMFAAHGIPALRFELPGTGDSSGHACDPGLFESWTRAVADAASELRSSTGVSEVAVLGVRMGALLALSAAGRGADIQDLILWGPAVSGRAVLRELRAFSQLARAEYAVGAPPPPPPFPGMEIGGFLIAPETEHALETLDFSILPEMTARRALVLSRDDLPADEKLVSALRARGCTVEVRNGDGYSAMMAIPDDSIPPETAGHEIIEFLSGTPQHEPPDRSVKGKPDTGNPVAQAMTAIETDSGSAFETIYTVERPSGSIFGILSEPGSGTPPAEWCLLFLNPGSVRHIGPNRMWVEAARRWAARGVASLRLDFPGIGESDGATNLDLASQYHDQLMEAIEMILNTLRSRNGIRRFAVIGLCSGAFWAFHTAIRDRDTRAAILLNPRLFFWDPAVDRRRLLRRTARLLTEGTDWARMLRGYISVASFKRVSRMILERLRANRRDDGNRLQIPPEAMARARAALDRNQSRVTLVFTEGEPLLREMEEEGHLPGDKNSLLRCIRVANCGHTFRPLWAQKLVHELIDGELAAVIRDAAADSVSHAVQTPLRVKA